MTRYQRYEVSEKGKARKRLYARRYRVAMSKILKAAKAKPCKDCGREFPSCAMQFDHVRGLKKFEIAHVKDRGIKALLSEMKKCELVCANCHAIRTHRRRRR